VDDWGDFLRIAAALLASEPLPSAAFSNLFLKSGADPVAQCLSSTLFYVTSTTRKASQSSNIPEIGRGIKYSP
jgi:hypothetical protein